MRNALYYGAVIILSALFLFVGNRIAGGRAVAQYDEFGVPYYSGVIIRIVDRAEETISGYTNTTITFETRLTGRTRRGEVITAQQLLTTFFLETESDREVVTGDRVVLAYDLFGSRYDFVTFVRINAVVLMGVALLTLIILFGRIKGLNAIVALGFTCMAVFLVFVPAILAGRNIYVTTVIVCVFSIVSTLLIVIGPNKKAVSAMLGCFGGVVFAAVLMLIMNRALGLLGIVSNESIQLLHLETPINLPALVFAGVILGAVGAIMDVAMSIASSLWEVKEAGEGDFSSIFASGVNIGKDILGTMLNTLILAYIGSSLTLILLITIHVPSFTMLFNSELIIVELLRALVGSFGMFLTIPLTAGICAWLYTHTMAVEFIYTEDENGD